MSSTKHGLTRCPKCKEFHDATWGRKECEMIQKNLRRIEARYRRSVPRLATGPDGKYL